jgi:thiamine pyrophosphokinase
MGGAGSTGRRAIVFANGIIHRWPPGLRIAPRRDLLVAADGGLRHCAARGLVPHLVAGDLDSAEPQAVAALEAAGVEILRFPAGKDATDLELALRAALARGARRLRILGALGAREDMTLGNALLLAAPFLAGCDARILEGRSQIRCLRGGGTLRLAGRPGDTLSLLPVTARATGLRGSGLAYPLADTDFELGSTRGLSNRLTRPTALVALRQGVLLVIQTAQGAE